MTNKLHHYFTLPNALSVLRILLLPPLLVCYRAEMFVPTLGLFLISAISDWLDGAIARRWHLTSDFGRMLDPLADKVTFVTLIVVLSKGVIHIFPIATLVLVEILLLIAGILTYMSGWWQRRFRLGANIYGKIKTCCETLFVFLLIVWHFFPVLHAPLFLAFLYTILFCCLLFGMKSIVRHIQSTPH